MSDWNTYGTKTVHLGRCEDDQRIKCLALMDCWNYIAWFYQPSPQIIDGSWVGPMVQTA